MDTVDPNKLHRERVLDGLRVPFNMDLWLQGGWVLLTRDNRPVELDVSPPGQNCLKLYRTNWAAPPLYL